MLVNPHTFFGAGAGEFEDQSRRVDDRAGLGGEQAGEVGRGIDLGPDLLLVEEPALTGGGRLPQPGHLMCFGGHVEHAGSLPVDVHAVFLDVGLHAVEVVQAQAFELIEFGWPARLPVRGAVSEAGFDKAAIAPRGRPADPFGLDQHDGCAGIAFGGMQCCPQAGVPAADHEQVAGRRAGQAGVVRPRDIQPHRAEDGRRQRASDQSLVDGMVENDAHAEMVPRPAGSHPGGPKM